MLDYSGTDDFIIQNFAEDTQIPPIRFGQLRPFLEDDAGRKHILAAFPFMRPKTVFRAKGYFQAKVHPGPHTGRGGNTLRVLCDENISFVHMRTCQRLFGYATHIAFENMRAQPDTDVWRFAVEQGFDLVLTHDSRNKDGGDLTHIALADWQRHMLDPAIPLERLDRLPMLLHINDEARDGDRFGKIVAAAFDRILEAQAQRAGPVLVLNQGGLRTGVHAFDLLRRKPDKGVARTATRESRWAYKYMNQVIPDRNAWSDREDPKVLASKRNVTRAVAIAVRGSDELAKKRGQKPPMALTPAA